jgi:hypothetical protein
MFGLPAHGKSDATGLPRTPARSLEQPLPDSIPPGMIADANSAREISRRIDRDQCNVSHRRTFIGIVETGVKR